MNEPGASDGHPLLHPRSLCRPGHKHRQVERLRTGFKWMSWVLFGIIVVLVLWDIALASNLEENDTWSEQTRLAAPRWPVLPWFIGALIGHLFPPWTSPIFERESAAGVMVFITIVIAMWSIGINAGFGLPTGPEQVWLLAVVGGVFAYFLWPSEPPPRPRSAPDAS